MKNFWMDSVSYPGWWKVTAVWRDIIEGEQVFVCLSICLLDLLHESEQAKCSIKMKGQSIMLWVTVMSLSVEGTVVLARAALDTAPCAWHTCQA